MSQKIDLMKFAGAWKMSDEEFGKIEADLEKLWRGSSMPAIRK